MSGGGREALRAWLEYVAQTAIDWLDQMDRADEDLEDDLDAEALCSREEGWR